MVKRPVLKKGITLFMIFILVFQLVGGASAVFAEGDANAPEVRSLEVSPREVEVGEEVIVKADIFDETGVNFVLAAFKLPGGDRYLDVILKLNEETGLYEGKYLVTATDAQGTWTLNYLGVTDTVGNSKNYYPNDFSNTIEFTIFNSDGDANAPEVRSLEVSPREVEVGEEVNVRADIYDKTGVNFVLAAFKLPGGDRYLDIILKLNEKTGLYEGKYLVTATDADGMWTLSYIGVVDTVGNRKNYYPRDFSNQSEINFIKISSVSDIENVLLNDPSLPYAISTKNEAWINKTIDKDLYIGPDSTITIADNVTITGDVFVYGTLISHGGLEIQGDLNAKSITYSSNTSTSPGAVRIVGGQNSIGSMIVSNQPYKVPFAVFNEDLTNETGSTVIEGKTLPFLEVSLHGNPVSLEADGSFTVTAEELTSDGLQFNLRDVFGNNMTKEVAVKDVLPPSAVIGFAISKTTHNEIQVIWNNNNDSDLKEYQLYLNEEKIMTVPAGTTNYTFANLDEGTGYEIAIAAVDNNGNTSSIVKKNKTTDLSKPVVNQLSDKDASITGQAYPGTLVTVYKGDSIIGSGNVNSEGKFSISIPVQKAGTELYAIVMNQTGIISGETVILVKDKTAPGMPAVSNVTDKSLLVTGTAEAGSLVKVKAGGKQLGESSADKDGNFSVAIEKQKAGTIVSVTAEDAAGNMSAAKEITVLDVTAPKTPIVNQITNKSIEITGTAEALGKVTVSKGSVILIEGKASADGSYRLAIESQAVGTKFEVYVADQAGNVSDKVNVTVVKENPEQTARISGDTRYDTAIAISQEGWESADTVILATGADFPDALAGGPLAYQQDAPILLTRPASLFGASEKEIVRLKAKKVIILGSTSAVSKAVEEKLEDMDLVVERIGGATRFDTAKLIAARLPSDQAILAYGLNFPDVLAISPYAAKNGIPILLTRTDRIPAETKDALINRKSTIVVGSTDAVSAEVFKQLPKAVRYGGKTRYETAKAINLALPLGNEQAYVATGRNFPDALAGSVLAAKNNASMLLVTEKAIPTATNDILSTYLDYTIFGSTGAVGTEVEVLLNKELERQHTIK